MAVALVTVVLLLDDDDRGTAGSRWLRLRIVYGWRWWRRIVHGRRLRIHHGGRGRRHHILRLRRVHGLGHVVDRLTIIHLIIYLFSKSPSLSFLGFISQLRITLAYFLPFQLLFLSDVNVIELVNLYHNYKS
jgi:hypothetical protein